MLKKARNKEASSLLFPVLWRIFLLLLSPSFLISTANLSSNFFSSEMSNNCFPKRGDKIKKEKSDADQKIDGHESYISFLQSSLTELTEYANQMGTIEKEQSNTLLDLSNNLNKISTFYSSVSLTLSHKRRI